MIASESILPVNDGVERVKQQIRFRVPVIILTEDLLSNRIECYGSTTESW